MGDVKMTIHRTGRGTCALTGRAEADGLTITFDDRSVVESHVSWLAFRQLLGLKTGGTRTKPAQPPTPAAPAATK